jgi:hypothetical protein
VQVRRARPRRPASRRSPCSTPSGRGLRPGHRWPPCSPTRPSRSCSTRAARTSRCCAASGVAEPTNIFRHPGGAGFAGLPRPARLRARLLNEIPRRRLRKSRASRSGIRGRSARRGRLRAPRTCCTSCSCHPGLQERLDAIGPAAVGDRGVPVPRGHPRPIATPDVFFEKSPGSAGWSGHRAVARELVVWREEAARQADPPRLERPAGRDARGDREAPAEVRRAPHADPRPARGDAAPPRRRDHRRGRARARAPADPLRATSAPRSPRRRTRRSSRSPRRSCAPVRSRTTSPTSSWPPARTCSASCSRFATTRRCPDVRTLQGWRRELIGDEIVALLTGDLALAMGPRPQDRGPRARRGRHRLTRRYFGGV